eukprot:4660178-Pyramimonas_sp.AAC.1
MGKRLGDLAKAASNGQGRRSPLPVGHARGRREYVCPGDAAAPAGRKRQEQEQVPRNTGPRNGQRQGLGWREGFA